MKKYQIAVLLDVTASSYQEALATAEAAFNNRITKKAFYECDISGHVVQDYQYSSFNGARVLYLHPEDQPEETL
jgi:hypothetical protein